MQTIDALPVTGTTTCLLTEDMLYLKQQLPQLIADGLSAFNPPQVADNSEYEKFITANQLNAAERLLILMALAQDVEPDLFNDLLLENNPYRLAQDSKTGQLLPTGATFIKLVAGKLPAEVIKALSYFDAQHLFYKKSVLALGNTDEGVAPHFGVLKISGSYKDLFLFNRHKPPRFSAEFPAHRIETVMDWSDLVANPTVLLKLEEIKLSLVKMPELLNDANLAKHNRAGYRCLFYGPSGTGKTLAATLLGKYVGLEVYRIDLSAVISKYVGETSKNLSALFNTAEDKNWALFFDEGDALFGKRIDTAQADDKNAHHSNQDIAYLLQRIENYNGLVIVNSNLPKNMDEAFSRRFEISVKFDILNPELSKSFWQDNLPKAATLSPGINFDKIVANHQLSPAQIINVIRRLWLKTLGRNETTLRADELERCILDEKIK